MAKNDKGLKWNLDDIFPVEKEGELKEEIEKGITMLQEWWPKMKARMTKESFKEFISFDQELGEKIGKLLYRPELMMATNPKNSQARLMKATANEIALRYDRISRKFDHWLKGLEVEGKETLDDKNAKRLFGAVPDLKYKLNYARLAAKHTLSQKEEEIISYKDTYGQEAISDLRELIESEMSYEVGKRKFKTQAEILKYIHSPSKKMRRAAYKTLLKKQKDNVEKLFVIYQSVVKDWAFEARIRGYKSPISMRNFANQISDEAVESLLKVCRDERAVFWDYFKFKAKKLKLNKLERFDVYAPWTGAKNKKYSFEESREIVLQSYYDFDKEMGLLAKRVFDDNHIDSHPYLGKRSGAFCATVGPKVTPFVMLNHTNTIRDVATLAHELGHAIHSLLANKHWPGSQQASLPLAETASTLGETILFEKLLAAETNKEIKRQMLWEKIGESYATILRQNYFVLFEKEAHGMIEKGTTAEELSKTYLRNLKEQFGKSVIVNPIFKYEWLYISHIFETPFYCYAYNFGELLALSLYAQYKKNGKMVEKIKKILETGGSEEPAAVLKGIGIEIGEEKFWKSGFEVIKGWQEELENV